MATEQTPRAVPAPELREVAQTWWDRDVDPVVVWDVAATTFTLADPDDPGGPHRLHLLQLATPADDPTEVAAVLAEGLAACDFPPTGDRAAPGRVQATLRVARLAVEPDERSS